MTHSLIRTNPIGQPFVGRCFKCGVENIPLAKMRDECPNPANITESEAVLVVIEGCDDDT
jgi:hypothetical protein